MDITAEIRAALCRFMEGKSGKEVGNLIGVAHSTVNNWKNGKRNKIRPAHWAKLKRHLEPYLPKDTPTPTQRPRSRCESNAEFVTEMPFREVPPASAGAAPKEYQKVRVLWPRVCRLAQQQKSDLPTQRMHHVGSQEVSKSRL